MKDEFPKEEPVVGLGRTLDSQYALFSYRLFHYRGHDTNGT